MCAGTDSPLTHVLCHAPVHSFEGGQQGKQQMLEELEKKRTAHLKLFDRKSHEELVQKGIRQFNFEATMACVFVQTFANELVMQVGRMCFYHDRMFRAVSAVPHMRKVHGCLYVCVHVPGAMLVVNIKCIMLPSEWRL